MTDRVLSLRAHDDPWRAAFLELGLERGLRHIRAASWLTQAEALPRLGEVVASSHDRDGMAHVVAREDGVVRVRLEDGWVAAEVAADSVDGAQALLAVVRHRIPRRPAPRDDEPEATISFWVHGTQGPECRERTLDVPTWAAVAHNYPATTRRGLAGLMEAELPLPGGRLVVWHGPPGTGKTNALRSLAWEWRSRAELHYITDPETLLTVPSYLQSVLTAGSATSWRVLVLEDTRLQALPQLLNVTDGFVGQGFRVLVLVTGNEPAERLPPALTRPGRCAALVGFERFDAAEAATWLGSSAGAATLAELYARRDGRALPEPGRQIGFAA